LNEEYLKADQTYKQVISGHLMKIYTPNAKELGEWSAAREDIKAQWLKDVGERGAKALSLIDKHNGELTYKKTTSGAK
jgi:TRAP-type C4-dicarboxylate transport system substrate-binding protein